MGRAARRLQRAHASGQPSVSGVWATALQAARGGQGRANILFIGDSYFEGVGLNSQGRQYRWIDRLVTQLRTQEGLGLGGQGFTATRWSSQLGSWAASTGTGAATNSENYQAARGSQPTSGQYREWTTSGDSVDVLYSTSSGGGSIVVAVDGATVDTFSTNSAATYSNVKHYTFGSTGTHTFRVTASGGTIGIDGIVSYNGDYQAGISYWDCSRGGYTSNNFRPSTGASQGWANGDIHLIIESLYGNDYLTSAYTPAVSASRLQDRLNRYQSLPHTPDVVVLLYWGIQSFNGDNSLGYSHADYRAALSAVVQNSPATLVDLYEIYGTVPPSYIGSDGVHPTVTGHQAIADALLTAI